MPRGRGLMEYVFILRRCNGRSHRSLCTGQSVRGSKTMFSNTFCASFHLTKLSFTGPLPTLLFSAFFILNLILDGNPGFVKPPAASAGAFQDSFLFSSYARRLPSIFPDSYPLPRQSFPTVLFFFPETFKKPVVLFAPDNPPSNLFRYYSLPFLYHF